MFLTGLKTSFNETIDYHDGVFGDTKATEAGLIDLIYDENQDK